MSFATARLAASTRSLRVAGTAAIVAPYSGGEYAEAFARKGWKTVAVDLDARLRPLALADANIRGPYADTVEHRGSLRHTVKALRRLGVTAVVTGSVAGTALADRIASMLDLPCGNPATSQQRCDRGAQAAALSAAAVPAPNSVRTTSLSEALKWAELFPLSSYVLAPAAVGVPVEPVVCTDEFQVSVSWPDMRRAAARHSGDGHLVLAENLPGREYLVHSVTWPGPQGQPDHLVTDIWAEKRFADGRLDRTDLLDRQPLLTRALSIYTLRVLNALGVVRGPVISRIAYSATRGPLLISALAVPGPPLANEAFQAATGRERFADLVDAWISPPPTEPVPVPTGRRVVRVHLQPTDGGDGIDPWLGRILRQLPTVEAVSAGLQPHAALSTPLASTEVVLSSDEPDAVEADYRVIRALEREGLYRGGRA
ncbi:hypothetical protein [Streptomyces chartreusis]|uniref:ATP-grasp domain-containing protein n=1 Tax=Streptomyces chartreusis TaxID=1969 RepID=A0A7H8T9Y5_STRCX|nr:hypothetical protein [Streptomyces chartreusis]QKZ20319.1 hypothetical protein HUT05_24995 [Streptomyces chartreusis]